MSLAVGILNHSSGILCSDGLAWKDGKIVTEDAVKQINLGGNISIASCGLMDNTRELFGLCQRAYDQALLHDYSPLESVKSSLRLLHNALPKPDDELQSRSTALLMAQFPNGRMYGAHIGTGQSLQEFFPEPDDPPTLMFLIPSIEVQTFLLQHLAPKVVFYRGEQSQFIPTVKKELPLFYAEAAKVHEPPKCNSNIAMTLFDGSHSTFIPQAIQAQPKDLHGANCNSIANGSIMASVTGTANTAVALSTSSNTTVLSTPISANGGEVLLFSYVQVYSTATTMYQLWIQDSVSNLNYSSMIYENNITAGDTQCLTIYGVDPAPPASRTYALTGDAFATGVTVEESTLNCINIKK